MAATEARFVRQAVQAAEAQGRTLLLDGSFGASELVHLGAQRRDVHLEGGGGGGGAGVVGEGLGEPRLHLLEGGHHAIVRVHNRISCGQGLVGERVQGRGAAEPERRQGVEPWDDGWLCARGGPVRRTRRKDARQPRARLPQDPIFAGDRDTRHRARCGRRGGRGGRRRRTGGWRRGDCKAVLGRSRCRRRGRASLRYPQVSRHPGLRGAGTRGAMDRGGDAADRSGRNAGPPGSAARRRCRGLGGTSARERHPSGSERTRSFDGRRWLGGRSAARAVAVFAARAANVAAAAAAVVVVCRWPAARGRRGHGPWRDGILTRQHMGEAGVPRRAECGPVGAHRVRERARRFLESFRPAASAAAPGQGASVPALGRCYVGVTWVELKVGQPWRGRGTGRATRGRWPVHRSELKPSSLNVGETLEGGVWGWEGRIGGGTSSSRTCASQGRSGWTPPRPTSTHVALQVRSGWSLALRVAVLPHTVFHNPRTRFPPKTRRANHFARQRHARIWRGGGATAPIDTVVIPFPRPLLLHLLLLVVILLPSTCHTGLAFDAQNSAESLTWARPPHGDDPSISSHSLHPLRPSSSSSSSSLSSSRSLHLFISCSSS